MNKYLQVKVHVSDGQKEKIAKAVQSETGVSIKLSHSDLTGDHVIAVTQAQAKRLAQAYQNGAGMILKLSKTQVKHSAKIEGGFIAALLPLLATAGKVLASSVLPALATGALTGVGAAAGSKVVDAIAGKGVVYVKRGGQCYKIAKQGNGMYLRAYPKGSSLGEGLYLKNGSSYESVGAGLLLGPNSPFSSIPIIGALL